MSYNKVRYYLSQEQQHAIQRLVDLKEWKSVGSLVTDIVKQLPDTNWMNVAFCDAENCEEYGYI